MSGPTAAILLTAVIHVAGLAFLFWAIGGDIVDFFRSGPSGGGGGGGTRPPEDPVPAPPSGGDLLPLPDAEQARVRLREPGRIAERYPRPERRPAREPDRTPAHV